jgi:hypothetical protein
LKNSKFSSSEVAFKEISTNSGLGAGDCFLSYRWVIPVKDISEEDLRYDKEKHREMILDAAQSVLGCFGF